MSSECADTSITTDPTCTIYKPQVGKLYRLKVSPGHGSGYVFRASLGYEHGQPNYISIPYHSVLLLIKEEYLSNGPILWSFLYKDTLCYMRAHYVRFNEILELAQK